MRRLSKEEILSGEVDYTAEKLIHALKELINLRSKLNLNKNSTEWGMLSHIVIDLAKEWEPIVGFWVT